MNIFLDTWATTMWRACWQGGLVVLIAWTICRLLPSMPARFQCWLWRLAIVKFMVALLVPWFLNVPLLPARSVAIHDVSLQPARGTPAATETFAIPSDHFEARSKAIDQSRAISLPSVRELLCFAWIIGVVWGLAGLLAALYGTVRLRRQGHGTNCTSLVEQLAIQGRLFGFRSFPKLLEIDGDGSPMLVGIFRPVVLMPATTLDRLSIPEEKMVLGHELAHIKRGDLLWSTVASFVRALFFFHPLAWWSERQLKLVQEVAADELAIAQQRHDPINYGKLLVSVVGKFGPARSFPRISMETVGSLDTLTRRLVAMKRIGHISGRVAVASVIVLVGLVFLGIVPWRLVAAETKSQMPTVRPSSADTTFQHLSAVEPNADQAKAIEPTADQAKAIAEIEKHGGGVDVDEESPDKPVIGAILRHIQITDAGLARLKAFPQLHSLTLSGPQVTDAGLANLKVLPQLTTLFLAGTQVTDAGLVHLKALPQLETLILIGARVTDAGIEHLKGLTQLKVLDLRDTKVTDAGLEHLRGLINLQALVLKQANAEGVRGRFSTAG